jgi:hypothetical protein
MRVLRPYLVRHREWESLIVEALRRLEYIERDRTERLERLECSLSKLTDRLDALDVDRRALRRDVRHSGDS